MRQLNLALVFAALSVFSLSSAFQVMAGETVRSDRSAMNSDPLAATGAGATAGEPVPTPYKLIYQFRTFPASESVRAAIALDAFRRAAKQEGWAVTDTATYSRGFIMYPKRAGEKVSDIVVAKLKGCAQFDEECQRLVKNLNKRNEDVENLDAFAGEVSLPVQNQRLEIAVDAGDHYLEAKNIDGSVSAVMSGKLHSVSSILSKYAIPRIGEACTRECKTVYSLEVR